jgi:hypothetical protein
VGDDVESVSGRALRLTIVFWALCALAMVVAPAPVRADPEPRQPQVRKTQGWPGDRVDVLFPASHYYRIVGCRLYWERAKDIRKECDGDYHATIEVPDLPAGPAPLRWEMEYAPYPMPSSSAGPDVMATGAPIDFTVNGVTAIADRTEAEGGDPVTVTFAAVGGDVVVGDCGVDKPFPMVCSDDRRVRFTVPADAVPGSTVNLHWYAASGFQGLEHPDDGEIGVRVRPLPPVEFDVRGQAESLGPGQPYVATFRSLTPGVTIEGCGLTLGKRSACGASDVAVVMIPPDTPSGTTLTIPWDLNYASKRRGEKPGRATGELSLPVVAETSEMAVTVQPAKAYPGDDVVLSFASLRPRVKIIECLVFFPDDRGGVCQRSPRRWFARTKVPSSAGPGPMLLRWGAASISDGGQPIADSGAFVFTVLAGTKTAETPKIPTKDPPEADPRPPAFIATSDPETTTPGERVSVSVAPLTPGVTVVGCTAGFRDQGGEVCSETGGGSWTARPEVPAAAGPGDQPLDWHVTWRDTTGREGRDAGTIAYRVSAPGAAPPPAFQVEVAPPKAEPGDQVTVAHRALDGGVTITGCEAGFSSGGSMATCRDTGQGWVADVTVPESAPAGTGTVLWNVAYDRDGPGAADGFTRLEVAQVAGPGFWGKLAGFAGRVATGAVALVAFLAYRLLGDRVRHWRKRKMPEGVDVRPLPGAEAFRTDLGAPPREPHPVIGLSPIRAVPRIHLREGPR